MLPCSPPPTCTILPFNACHAPPATAPFSNPGYLLSATVLAKQPPPLKCRGPLLPPTNLARDASCSLSSAPPPPSFPPLSPIRLGVYSRRGGRRVGRTSVGNGRKGRRPRRGGRPSCSSSWVCGAEVSCSSSSPSPCSATCPPQTPSPPRPSSCVHLVTPRVARLSRAKIDATGCAGSHLRFSLSRFLSRSLSRSLLLLTPTYHQHLIRGG